MKSLAVTLASLSLLSASLAHANQTDGASSSPSPTASVTLDDIRSVSSALEKYASGVVQEDLWTRPGLTTRDRSIVTVATLIARNQTIEMARHINLALDNGVKPAEISEIITHLAFYAGWSSANAAAPYVREAFARRGIGADQLPRAAPAPLPLDEAREAARAMSC